MQRYERIVFEKALIAPPGQPPAAFVCPGSALLDATLDVMLERHRDLLRRGTVLVDEHNPGTDPRVLFYLEHTVHDAHVTQTGDQRAVSRRMLYVEIDHQEHTRKIQYAPYLDYRPLRDDDPDVPTLLERPDCAWIDRSLEQKALAYAIQEMVPEHLDEVREQRLEWIEKTRAAVKERLVKEINHWDHRAEELKVQEQAGKPNARLNSQEARRRADELQARLQERLEQLDLEAQIAARPPVVLGGLVVIPQGLLDKMTGKEPELRPVVDNQKVAARARAIVMEVERALGFEPTDREFEKLGWDVESRIPRTGKLRFIEVKGRTTKAKSISVTKNEILHFLNKPDDFILAIVEFFEDKTHKVHYVRKPFRREPDFGVTSVDYDFAFLLKRAEPPE